MRTDNNSRFIMSREGRPLKRCRTSADAMHVFGQIKNKSRSPAMESSFQFHGLK